MALERLSRIVDFHLPHLAFDTREEAGMREKGRGFQKGSQNECLSILIDVLSCVRDAHVHGV